MEKRHEDKVRLGFVIRDHNLLMYHIILLLSFYFSVPLVLDYQLNNILKIIPILWVGALCKQCATRQHLTTSHATNAVWSWRGQSPYLIFVLFFTQPQFEAQKFYTWKCVNSRQKVSRDKTAKSKGKCKIIHCV